MPAFIDKFHTNLSEDWTYVFSYVQLRSKFFNYLKELDSQKTILSIKGYNHKKIKMSTW